MSTTTIMARANDSIINISTEKTSLLLRISESGKNVSQLYYGVKINDSKNLNQIAKNEPLYPAFGNLVTDAACRIRQFDGNPTTDLVFKHFEQHPENNNSSTYVFSFEDSHYPVKIEVCFRTFVNEDMIEQWTVIENGNKTKPIVVNEAASSFMTVKSSYYYLNYLNGNWANEGNLNETKLAPGAFVLDSKEGVRTAQKIDPSFLLSLDEPLSENAGQVIAGSLAWPGNWKIQFSVNDAGSLNIWSGINPYASDYLLGGGGSLTTPSLFFTYSNSGAATVTHNFHDWARKYGMSHGNEDGAIILNNWETTGMGFTEQRIADLMKAGGEMGMDLFLLDDGWFGLKYPRDDDQHGLGDWITDTAKLPHGLSYLADKAKENNMKFGLWVEPEMVNPKSDLYERHQDWALSAPNRNPDLQRNQLILDLTNPKVKEYVLDVLTKILTDHPGIQYLKWDCNRFLTNAWSNNLGNEKQSNLYTDYNIALLDILKQFRKKFPDITMMLCASGGGRMDYGMLKYFNEYWLSDNTNPHDRVKIQWGLSYFFPVLGMASHISEMGDNYSLKFRTDVAMSGKLGFDMNLAHLNNDQHFFVKKAIEEYKSIKNVIFQGDLYRIVSPYQGARAVLMYVNKAQNRAVVFSYQLQKVNGGDFTQLRMKGLKPYAKYKLKEINKGSYSRFDDYEGKVLTGDFLMNEGVRFSMWSQDESTVFELEEVK